MLQLLSITLILISISAIIKCEFKAKCVMIQNGNSGVNGTIWFEQNAATEPVKVSGEVFNLIGTHGFHIHEAAIKDNNCTSALGHYNPFNVPHGAKENGQTTRHVGDLGNVSQKGNPTKFSFEDDLLSLTGTYSIVGRSCVVHQEADDLGKGTNEASQLNGNSGPRIACGTIVVDNNSIKTSISLVLLIIVIMISIS